MPSTMVQKMTGTIIILIRLTNMVPRTPTLLPTSGASSPTTTPATTATMTARYSQWVRSRLVGGAGGSGWVVMAASFGSARKVVCKDGVPPSDPGHALVHYVHEVVRRCDAQLDAAMSALAGRTGHRPADRGHRGGGHGGQRAGPRRCPAGR